MGLHIAMNAFLESRVIGEAASVRKRVGAWGAARLG